SAEPYTQVTWASGVDMRTGRPIETPHARYGTAMTTLTPGPNGGHNWQPMSYNPDTELVYIPVSENSFAYGRDPDFEFLPRAWNLGIDLAASFGMKPGTQSLPESEYAGGTGESTGVASSLLAWDPVAAAPRWRVPHEGETGGGTLTTAGNLVFQGTDAGRLAAYSADRG